MNGLLGLMPLGVLAAAGPMLFPAAKACHDSTTEETP